MLIIALLAAAGSSVRPKQKRADLTIWVFAQQHRDVYDSIVGEFHDKTGLTVDVQLVSALAMDLRLSSLFMSDPTSPELPDLAEIEMFWVGKYLRPPVDQIGFVPLNNLLTKSGWMDKIVKQRLAPWTKEGTTFGAPHDVHPVTIMYRRDLFWGEEQPDGTFPRPTHRSRIHKTWAGISRQMPRVRTVSLAPRAIHIAMPCRPGFPIPRSCR